MSNLSDKELDRLSREAADSYEPGDHSLSWSRLEQKLSEEMPERPPDLFRFNRRNPIVWGSAVILVSGLSFFIIKKYNYNPFSTQTNSPIAKVVSSSENRKETTSVLSQEDSSSTSGLTDLNANGHSDGRDQSRKDGGTITTEAQYIESAMGNSRTSIVSGQGNQRNATAGSWAQHRNKKTKGNLIAGSVSELSNDDHSSTYPGTGEKLSSTGNSEANGVTVGKPPVGMPSPENHNLNLGTIRGNDSLMNALARQKTSKPDRSIRINRSLNVGLTFGPDYTDAGGVANNQFGSNIGVTVGYYLTSKLSVNSGLIYSNKFYWTPRKGPAPQLMYAPGPQQIYLNAAPSAAAPAPIEYANGASSLWEIPVTVRYDFAGIRKSRFFASAGMSSYIVMKQTSVYYSHNGSAPLAWIKTDNSQVNYWFNVVNISAGIETHVGRGLSFQFEPYMKLPLKNMGMENLKLNSYGMLISIRYAPALGRSKK